jgi:TRAP-type C4-dicarboxylate transport system permease large subunit
VQGSVVDHRYPDHGTRAAGTSDEAEVNLKGYGPEAKVSMETAETTAFILLIMTGASIFGYLITTAKITDNIADVVLSITTRPWLILLLGNIILLIVGCSMETIVRLTTLVPVVLLLMEKIRVNPVHFGLVMVLNLMISLLTPHVGMARSGSAPTGETPD